MKNKTHLSFTNKTRTSLRPTVILALVIFMLVISTMTVAARQLGDWAPPVNLSNSGAATNADVVIDSKGISHVIWNDTFEGYRYAQSLPEGGWSKPVTVNFPFGINKPQLVQGTGIWISAFWKDGDNRLYSSMVNENEFGFGVSWEKTRVLADDVVSYSVSASQDGRLNIVYYTRSGASQMPSGVYYRYAVPGVITWSDPILVYESLYLRNATTNSLFLSVASQKAGDQTTVLAAWDETPLNKIYLSRSSDGGRNWETPTVAVEPGKAQAAGRPFGVNVTAWNEQMVMTWKVGNPESSCAVTYQTSSDLGSTWKAGSEITRGLSGCAANTRFFGWQAGILYWQADINGQLYLFAWDGTRWSDPQAQPGLSGAEDPVTGRGLKFNNWSIAYSSSLNTLAAASVDTDGNQDAWYTVKDLGNAQNWFPAPSEWKNPVEVYSSDMAVNSLQMLADNGHFHSIWLQSPQDGGAVIGAKDTLSYARITDSSWSQPVMVLQAEHGALNHLTARLSSDGRIIATWQDNLDGKIYFSWAIADKANISAEWAQPVALPEDVKIGQSPDIFATSRAIYIAYVLPINERRGIYLTQSTDGGKTWSEPARVFNGQGAGWEIVGEPSLAVTYDGHIHVLWTRESLPGTRGSLGLYYTSSIDNGTNWSQARAVSENSVSWAQLIAAPGGYLYEVWLESAAPNIVHSRVSADYGNNWSTKEALAGEGTPIGVPDLFADPAGTLRLLQFFKDLSGNVTLQSWEISGDEWILGEQQASDPGLIDPRIAAAVTTTGEFAVIYTDQQKMIGSTANLSVLRLTSRMVALPAVLPTPPALAVQAGEPSAVQMTETPTGLPTETEPLAIPTLNAQDLPASSRPAGNYWSGLIVGVVLSGLLVVVGFIVLFTRRRLR